MIIVRYDAKTTIKTIIIILLDIYFKKPFIATFDIINIDYLFNLNVFASKENLLLKEKMG
jgi:hypothetical protein